MASQPNLPDRAGRAATVTDVARAAGVSHQTVSRVLNGHPSVRPDTRRRVQEAIERLGYRRNSAARALVTKRSQALGVIGYETTLYGPMRTLNGVERAAREAGYFVAVANSGVPTPASLREAVSRLTDQGVEGIVVIAPVLGTVAALDTLRDTLPLVVAEGGVAPGLPVVSVDQELGARMATRHLLDQGVDTVWHVAGPANWLEAEARLAGWQQELVHAGARVPDPPRGDWSPANGYEIGRKLARRGDVQAVFVANDQMAIGLLHAFAEAGIAVPDDVVVAGFDDVPEAAYYPPPLTTVRQDFASVGQRSIELLLDQIGGDRNFQKRVQVAPELIIRQSSQRLAARHRSAHR
ncbi:LacI family DNA-binding transcriptional regulator [Saccharopolyspora sp. K220]|uniref:LacI family DNA-binding transcriptional regulator n=1 Tax=Saccharopolyspora soli TaxID=2926618 RepID=UPI001F597EEC|nr:LacI family DNA-binding transcriptional regulator [Saccharopolyspora soli]MCI2415944.1 LacI family DNA-binding transcriptional regulator [Saccharopolyspora soli]